VVVSSELAFSGKRLREPRLIRHGPVLCHIRRLETAVCSGYARIHAENLATSDETGHLVGHIPENWPGQLRPHKRDGTGAVKRIMP